MSSWIFLNFLKLFQDNETAISINWKFIEISKVRNLKNWEIHFKWKKNYDYLFNLFPICSNHFVIIIMQIKWSDIFNKILIESNFWIAMYVPYIFNIVHKIFFKYFCFFFSRKKMYWANGWPRRGTTKKSSSIQNKQKRRKIEESTDQLARSPKTSRIFN